MRLVRVDTLNLQVPKPPRSSHWAKSKGALDIDKVLYLEQKGEGRVKVWFRDRAVYVAGTVDTLLNEWGLDDGTKGDK